MLTAPVQHWNKDEEINLSKDNLLRTIPTFPKEYEVMFEMSIVAFSGDYQSVIHFTIGGPHGNFGDRIPAVWVHKNKRIHICSAVSGKFNHVFNYPINETTKNQWQ